MATTIASIQTKIIEKMDQKYKGGFTRERMTRIFADKDSNGDGWLTLGEFKASIMEGGGNALNQPEMEFLFHFWDTMANQQDPQGAVEITLAVQDLASSMPQYSTGFNSGQEKSVKPSKNGLPSQSGGIFGGGSYEADSMSDRSGPQVMPPSVPQAAQGAAFNRPRGNQPSVEGGIFGDAGPAPPMSNRGGGNISNRSSIQGGIFGEQAPQACAPANKKNSNQSSIPGGIFG